MSQLAYCRVQNNREFFKEAIETIVRVVRECCYPFAIKDFLPAPGPEQPPDISEIVSSALEKEADEKQLLDTHHCKIADNIREDIRQALPILAELRERLPSENLKAVMYDPQFDFARQPNRASRTEVKLIDVVFFGKLVKAPIKILVYRDSEEFLQLSRMVQVPVERQWGIGGSPNLGKYYVFDDDGRWLQISGSVICVWSKPKDINDGDFLYGYGFELKVSTINSEADRYSQEGRYKTRELAGYFSNLKDFVRTVAIVCADNANLCPVIDRYFRSTGGRASLNGSYVSQQPVMGAMKPYMMTETKGQR